MPFGWLLFSGSVCLENAELSTQRGLLTGLREKLCRNLYLLIHAANSCKPLIALPPCTSTESDHSTDTWFICKTLASGLLFFPSPEKRVVFFFLSYPTPPLPKCSDSVPTHHYKHSHSLKSFLQYWNNVVLVQFCFTRRSTFTFCQDPWSILWNKRGSIFVTRFIHIS